MSFVMSSTIQPSRVRYTVLDKYGTEMATITDLDAAREDAFLLDGTVRIDYQEIK